MALQNFSKEIYDEFVIEGNFQGAMGDSESIVAESSAIIAEDKDGTDVTSIVLDTTTATVDGQSLKVRCRGGSVEGSPYKISFKIVTSLSNKFEVDVVMEVLDS